MNTEMSDNKVTTEQSMFAREYWRHWFYCGIFAIVVLSLFLATHT
jgi:hypothetical protein